MTEQSHAEPTPGPDLDDSHCAYAGPGRGDCEHFVGLPGELIPGQHDGLDDTVDVYGRANGWCWFCWHSFQLQQTAAQRDRLVKVLTNFIEAFDSGNLQIHSREIDPGDPEIPPHPWHEEWLSLARAALAEARKP